MVSLRPSFHASILLLSVLFLFAPTIDANPTAEELVDEGYEGSQGKQSPELVPLPDDQCSQLDGVEGDKGANKMNGDGANNIEAPLANQHSHLHLKISINFLTPRVEENRYKKMKEAQPFAVVPDNPSVTLANMREAVLRLHDGAWELKLLTTLEHWNESHGEALSMGPAELLTIMQGKSGVVSLELVALVEKTIHFYWQKSPEKTLGKPVVLTVTPYQNVKQMADNLLDTVDPLELRANRHIRDHFTYWQAGNSQNGAHVWKAEGLNSLKTNEDFHYLPIVDHSDKEKSPQVAGSSYSSVLVVPTANAH